MSVPSSDSPEVRTVGQQEVAIKSPAFERKSFGFYFIWGLSVTICQSPLPHGTRE